MGVGWRCVLRCALLRDRYRGSIEATVQVRDPRGDELDLLAVDATRTRPIDVPTYLDDTMDDTMAREKSVLRAFSHGA